MPIQVECPSCHTTIRVPDEHAGRRGRCPRCKAVFVATAPARPGRPSPPRRSRPRRAILPRSDMPSRRPRRAVRRASMATATSTRWPTPPRRAKAVRRGAESLPGVGVSARGVAEAAAPTGRTLTAREILAAFGGRIEPVRPTLLYRLWILIVAAVMVLLPMVYVAIIGLVVAAVLYHAVHNIIDPAARPGAGMR